MTVEVLDPDTKGVLRWDVTMPARAKKEFRFEYVLEYPADFQQIAVPNAPAPAADAEVQPAAPRQQMVEQIDVLEKALK